jgi:hypothetical protein
MNRNKRLAALATAALAGIALGVFAGSGIVPALAGGVCRGAEGVTYTSNDAGDVLYEWHTERGKAQVIRYDYNTGTAIRRILVYREAEPTPEPEKPAVEGEKPEIVITGVIWVADPEKRVAIINGKTYREGEVFVTRTGRRFRVLEIKRTEDVKYEEVTEEEGED